MLKGLVSSVYYEDDKNYLSEKTGVKNYCKLKVILFFDRIGDSQECDLLSLLGPDLQKAITTTIKVLNTKIPVSAF